MDDLILEFLSEAQDGISNIDNFLVEFEKDPKNTETITQIFRILHTIKGTSGFLGLNRLGGVAHAGENILNRIREGTIEPTPHLIQLVFKSIDFIKFIVDTIKAEGSEPDLDFSDLSREIDMALNNGVMPSGEHGAGGEHSAPKEEAKTEESVDNHAKEEASTPPSPAPAIHAEEHKEPAGSGSHDESKQGKGKKSADKKTGSADSIRVRIDLLDHLMQAVSELVLTRNQLLQLNKQNYSSDSFFNRPLQQLSNITTDLQESVMKTRMQPISNVLSAYPRMIRDIANDLGKKVRLEFFGESTELDRHLLESIKDPLTHMIRNSVDHGIESPTDRIAVGKKEEGCVQIAAEHAAGHVVIKISDDGKGLNVERLRQKIVEKGLILEKDVASLARSQIFQFIFHPGFSTAEKVTSVSGRGVGMDVVKTNIEKIGGSIELNSKDGEGTCFTLKIPLTLAIMPVMIFICNENRYALPLINILELIRIAENSEYKIEEINESPILRLREKIIPLIFLEDILNDKKTDDAIHLASIKRTILICKNADLVFGLVVDKIIDIEEIVVKPLSQIFKNSEHKYSGTTILGDGGVIMIIDPQSISQEIKMNSTNNEIARKNEEASYQQKYHDEQRSSTHVLLFKDYNQGDVKAIPLEFVTRLEELDPSKIEVISGENVLRYRGGIMKLITLNSNSDKFDSESIEVIVFSDGQDIVGLAVQEIVDIVKYSFDQYILNSQNDKFIGSSEISNQLVEIVNISYIFHKSHGTPLIKQTLKEVSNDEKTSHVILVDDSAFFRKFIPPVMTSAGYKVTALDDASKVWDILAKNKDVCAIVTDLNMPGLSGADLLKLLRESSDYKKIPVIALSAFSHEEATKRGQDISQFNAYIQKTQHAKLLEILSELVAND